MDGFALIAGRYFNSKDRPPGLEIFSGMLGDIWYDDITIFPTNAI